MYLKHMCNKIASTNKWKNRPDFFFKEHAVIKHFCSNLLHLPLSNFATSIEPHADGYFLPTSNRNNAVEVLNSIKMGQRWRHNISGRKKPLRSHVKFYSLLQKNKMPGAPKQQSLLKLYICQKNQLFMGNILPTLDFFVFTCFLDFIYIVKSHCAKSSIWLQPL